MISTMLHTAGEPFPGAQHRPHLVDSSVRRAARRRCLDPVDACHGSSNLVHPDRGSPWLSPPALGSSAERQPKLLGAIPTASLSGALSVWRRPPPDRILRANGCPAGEKADARQKDFTLSSPLGPDRCRFTWTPSRKTFDVARRARGHRSTGQSSAACSPRSTDQTSPAVPSADTTRRSRRRSAHPGRAPLTRLPSGTRARGEVGRGSLRRRIVSSR